MSEHQETKEGLESLDEDERVDHGRRWGVALSFQGIEGS